MNVNTLIAALTLTIGAAAPGLAAAAPAMQDHMNLSRMEVRANNMAGPDTSYAAPGEGYSQFTAVSTESRNQVIAELQAARADNRLDQRNEMYGSFRPSQLQSTKSRAEVMADASLAQRRFDQQYVGA